VSTLSEEGTPAQILVRKQRGGEGRKGGLAVSVVRRQRQARGRHRQRRGGGRTGELSSAAARNAIMSRGRPREVGRSEDGRRSRHQTEANDFLAGA
jgi:hypothetical protein